MLAANMIPFPRLHVFLVTNQRAPHPPTSLGNRSSTDPSLFVAPLSHDTSQRCPSHAIAQQLTCKVQDDVKALGGCNLSSCYRQLQLRVEACLITNNPEGHCHQGGVEGVDLGGGSPAQQHSTARHGKHVSMMNAVVVVQKSS